MFLQPDRPGHVKWATIKKELTVFNDVALHLGFPRPGLTQDNQWLSKLHYHAGRSPATRKAQYLGITIWVARSVNVAMASPTSKVCVVL